MRSYILGTPDNMDTWTVAQLEAERDRIYGSKAYRRTDARLVVLARLAEMKVASLHGALIVAGSVIARELGLLDDRYTIDFYDLGVASRWWTTKLLLRVEAIAGMSYAEFSAVDTYADGGRAHVPRCTFEWAMVCELMRDVVKDKRWKVAKRRHDIARADGNKADDALFRHRLRMTYVDRYLKQRWFETQSERVASVRRTRQYRTASRALNGMTSRELLRYL